MQEKKLLNLINKDRSRHCDINDGPSSCLLGAPYNPKLDDFYSEIKEENTFKYLKSNDKGSKSSGIKLLEGQSVF